MENLENIDVNGIEGEAGQGEPSKTYTAEEVARMIQAESDRRTNQALAKQKKEYEKKMSLSKLDDDAREKAEKEAEIEELRNQLAAFQLERNRSELKSVLGARGLDVRFADIINITDDLEESQANIDTLDKLFKAAVKAEVEKRLAGSAPKGNTNAAPSYTKESISKMSLRDLQRLKQEQPEVYASLYN